MAARLEDCFDMAKTVGFLTLLGWIAGPVASAIALGLMFAVLAWCVCRQPAPADEHGCPLTGWRGLVGRLKSFARDDDGEGVGDPGR